MAPSAVPITPHATRLVRLLSDLAGSEVAFAQGNFAERLGGLVDFGDSMRLSALHDKLGKLQVEPGPISVGALQAALAQVRLGLVRSVVESFVAGAGSGRVKLPALKRDVSLDQLAGFEPYHRFYASHQREFEVRIQTLQLQVRDALAGATSELARLAALDEALRDTLAAHVRKRLACIPPLLGKRFEALREAPSVDLAEAQVLAAWTRPGGWLNRFHEEMQALLLAELELRLLPVLGLIGAVTEQVGKGDD